MFLVLVKVSSIMSLSYVESLVPKEDCNHNSRKTITVFLLSLPTCFQETHKNVKLETSVVPNQAENNKNIKKYWRRSDRKINMQTS